MACLRLKRFLEEDPVDAIVVSHKRRCLDRGDIPNEEIKTVFKFVGTVRSKDECVETHLSKAISQENGAESGAATNRKRVKEHTVDAVKKCKFEFPLGSKKSHFKLVRTVSEDETAATAAMEATVKGLYRLYDAEQLDENAPKTKSGKESEVITCNGTPLQPEDSEEDRMEYVYDLYYSNVPDYADDELLKDSIRIEYQTSYLETRQEEEEEDVDENDEDSNDELNWRNDYPDEDAFEDDYKEFNREGDESLDEQMASFGIGNGSYYEDSSGGEVDSEDERRFGREYAKFRARIKARHDEEDDDKDSGILTNARTGNPFAG